MYIYITLVILPVVTNSIILCESTSERPKEIQKSVIKTLFKECNLTSAASVGHNAKSSSAQHPAPNEPGTETEEKSRQQRTSLATPLHLTKVAKTLSLGFDPSFDKVYFEPFERRPRPMILVLLRKKGIDPKQILKTIEALDVAELQSPYNDIGSFWEDQPGEPEFVI